MGALVHIMSGIPGSGKSTYARQKFAAAVVVSADDLFVRPDGRYVFEPERIGEAHASCFRRFVDLLAAGTPLIVVDNTNVHCWEISPYVLAAQAYGAAAVQVHRLLVDTNIAWSRCVHEVPWRTVKAMADAMRDAPPLLPWWDVVEVDR